MRQAQRAHGQADMPLAGAETDPSSVLDHGSVLRALELETGAREDGGAYGPTRTGNGRLIGLGLSAIVLAVLGIIAGLGYL